MATLDGAREGARPSAFGARLRAYRVAAGLTQEALAERAGVSVRGLKYLEQGARRPYPDTLRRLANALALAPAERAAFLAAGQGAGAIGIARGTGTAPAVPGGAPPLVGRAAERALLERHLAGVGPPLLLLAGEPGIGKSRLLQETILPATRGGWRVLAGGCQRRGGHRPYAPLLDALQRYLQHQPAGRLHADLQGCAWLVRLLPELADGPIPPLPSWMLPPAQERRLMVEAVLRFLTNVAEPAGTLLILDDLQWADPDALELVGTLVRSAMESPLRVVGAYRDTEVPPPDALGWLLADLAQAGLAARRRLAPLGRAEAAGLLEELLTDTAEADGAVRERLLQRAGGVPFFLVSFAQGVRTGERAGVGVGADGERAREGVPWDVAQSIRQRVAALPGGAGTVLEAAAVLGRALQPAVLGAVVAQGERAVLEALAAAGRAGLLEETGEQGLQFAHDVIREVLEAELGATRRRVLHRRIAQALEGGAGAGPVEALAYHYARSDRPDTALPYLEQAGDQAQRQHAHVSADGHYREALHRLDALGRADEAARVREKQARSLYHLAKAGAAVAVLDEAAALYQAAGDREGVWRSLAQMGRMHAWQGRPQDGLARLEPLVPALAQSPPSPGAAVCWAALAWLYLSADRPRASITAAERAAQLARTVGDDAVLADVEVRRGTALWHLGRLREARSVLEGALPLVEAAGDLDPLARVLTNGASVCLELGEFERGQEALRRALAEAERSANIVRLQWALGRQGGLLFLRGDWGAARACLERSMELLRATGWWLAAWEPLVYLTRLHLALGDGVAARRYAEDPQLQRAATGVPELRRFRAEWDLHEGRAAAALARLTAQDSAAYGEPRDAVLRAGAHLQLGDPARATDLLVPALAQARSAGERLTLVDGLRLQALAYLPQRRWEEAAHALEEGLALARALPCPYAEAQLLHIDGVLHAAQSKSGQARARQEEARAIVGRLGVRPGRDATEWYLVHLARPLR